MSGCNQTLMAFSQGTVVTGGDQSCSGMQRGTLLTTGLRTTKTLCSLNLNRKTMYFMSSALPLSCAVLLPCAVLRPLNKHEQDGPTVRMLATPNRGKRPRWPKGKGLKAVGTNQKTGTIPTPVIFILQIVYETLYVLDVLEILRKIVL